VTDDGDTLTADDLEFLRRPLHGFFSPAAGATPPQPRPIWFGATDDGTLEMFAEASSVRVRRLGRDPRASLVVAAPVEERERWLAVTGRTTIEPGGADDVCRRLAARYWDLDDPVRRRDLDDMLATDQVRIVLHPERITRFSY
jgi:hypothetical protein